LALSSRNAYLGADERAKAPALYAALAAAAKAIAQGEKIEAAVSAARERILAAGFASVDYVDARHADSLAPLASNAEPGRILAAAHLGRARLIDNVAIPRA
jgi:pantoate--beta-alanine ligase